LKTSKVKCIKVGVFGHTWGHPEYILKCHEVIVGKMYDKIDTILEEEAGWFRVIDESGEDYCYPKNYFELV